MNPINNKQIFIAIFAFLIIGVSIIISAKIISLSIEKQQIAISEETLRKVIDEAIKSGRLNEEMQRQKLRTAVGNLKIDGVAQGSNPIKGDINAPVLMVEFSDFQCPFSKRFYQQTFPMIENEYILTGKVKFAYRDFPLAFHPLAKDAAIACKCAGKQNAYWQMFDKLSNADSLDGETINKYAQEIGLDIEDFQTCLDNEEVKSEIENDVKEGKGFGVKGTPAFFINGRVVSGAYPFETFKDIIEEELRVSEQVKNQ